MSNPQGLTPEHLFGAAWAACFNGAVNHVAKEEGHSDEGITVTAQVQLHPDGPQPFSVKFTVGIPDLETAKVRRIMEKARAICAYAKATKGNVAVTFTVG
ncbi:MAG: OsmC family protein [Undibacterium sp.]|nr:OsmC family protein [Opitutaceae bacterium]